MTPRLGMTAATKAALKELLGPVRREDGRWKVFLDSESLCRMHVALTTTPILPDPPDAATIARGHEAAEEMYAVGPSDPTRYPETRWSALLAAVRAAMFPQEEKP